MVNPDEKHRLYRSYSLNNLDDFASSDSESSSSENSQDSGVKTLIEDGATVPSPETQPKNMSQQDGAMSPIDQILKETSETVVVSSHSSPPRQGVWDKPILLNSSLVAPLHSAENATNTSSDMWPSLKDSTKVKGTRQLGSENHVRSVSNVLKGPQNLVETMEDDLRFPWAAKMNSASRNLYRATEPEYLPDGTPKVTIPEHVLLKGLENQKEYILGQFYRCLPPPGGLIHAVFNKLWGKKCRISVRKLGNSNYLFHIPDESTRTWVLQRGLWHVDDCLMFVVSWSAEATLAIPEIKTIPVWVTLKNIPNILYSIAGISHIASGLGAPMATDKPRLDPILMGQAKILVKVELSKAFPSRIAASDKIGVISMVDVEYAWLPTKCRNCGQLGHKEKRCLESPTQAQVDTSTESSLKATAETCKVTTVVSAVANLSATHIPSSGMEAPVSNGSRPPIEAQLLREQATPSIVQDHTLSQNVSSYENVTITQAVKDTSQGGSSKKPALNLGSNQFALLCSSEGEDVLDSESDDETELLDLLTPTGKRILRERPVKPSVKVKENVTMTVHGRGRGRGKRGGRG